MNRFLSGTRAPVGSGNIARSLLATALICLLSCALMVPYILHFQTRDEIERPVWNGLPLWSALEREELSLLDRRFADRGVRKPKSLDSIAIVGIDEASLQALNQWPWPRATHAHLIDRLHRAGARVIALDIGFDDYAHPTRGANGEVHLSSDDLALAGAMKRAGNVVLVSRLAPENKSSAGVRSDTSHLAAPVDELDALTSDLAVAYVKRDSVDDCVRRYPLRIAKPPEEKPIGGFAPLCVALYQGLARRDDLRRYDAALQAGIWPNASGGVEHRLPLERGVFPGGPDEASRTKVWTTPLVFWGPSGTFPTYSYSDVLSNWSDARLRGCFAGRLVFVGATTNSLNDTFAVPNFQAAATAEMPGVEIHATMAAMLMDGAFMHTQSLAASLWTLLGVTLAASVWTMLLCRGTVRVAGRAQAWWARRALPGRIFSPLWIGACALLGPLPLWAFWWGAEWAFAHENLWVIAIYPLVGAALASGGTLLLLFGAESSERRKIHTQMSRLVAPAVMEEILAHPEEDYPRPRRLHATVLFADLEGFTTYSESREPEEVVTALNAYFRRMQPIVHAHSGSVDKYIGDSLMAFFGAPVPRADHAALALRCAIALQDECARFRKETGVPFWMRVGVHTGDLIVGGVGSDEQNNYTAIGDAVNLASRLEESNKSFGSRIICSSDTHSEAPGVARVELSHTPIRGKTGTVEILIVRGPHDEPPRDAEWGHGDAAIDWNVHWEGDRRGEADRRLSERRRAADRRGGRRAGD